MISYKKIVASMILPTIMIVSVLIDFRYSEIHSIPNLGHIVETNIHRDISSGSAKESKDLLKVGLKVLEAKDLSKSDELEGFDTENALKNLEYTIEDRDSRDCRDTNRKV